MISGSSCCIWRYTYHKEFQFELFGSSGSQMPEELLGHHWRYGLQGKKNCAEELRLQFLFDRTQNRIKDKYIPAISGIKSLVSSGTQAKICTLSV